MESEKAPIESDIAPTALCQEAFFLKKKVRSEKAPIESYIAPTALFQEANTHTLAHSLTLTHTHTHTHTHTTDTYVV